MHSARVVQRRSPLRAPRHRGAFARRPCPSFATPVRRVTAAPSPGGLARECSSPCSRVAPVAWTPRFSCLTFAPTATCLLRFRLIQGPDAPPARKPHETPARKRDPDGRPLSRPWRRVRDTRAPDRPRSGDRIAERDGRHASHHLATATRRLNARCPTEPPPPGGGAWRSHPPFMPDSAAVLTAPRPRPPVTMPERIGSAAPTPRPSASFATPDGPGASSRSPSRASCAPFSSATDPSASASPRSSSSRPCSASARVRAPWPAEVAVPAGPAPRRPSNRFAIAGLDAVDDGGVGGTDQADSVDTASGAQVDPATDPQGPFLNDGTLVMPVAVDTTVDDGSALLKATRSRPVTRSPASPITSA